MRWSDNKGENIKQHIDLNYKIMPVDCSSDKRTVYFTRKKKTEH